MGIRLDSMSLDTLDVMADKKMYKRFDRLFIKSRPLGEPILREIFLKTNNYC